MRSRPGREPACHVVAVTCSRSSPPGPPSLSRRRACSQGLPQAGKPTKPTKVVIILVDALSKEIVDKYDMANVQALMADYVDTPKGYLGHTGSVTVVTHNVITSGLLPKHMGWTTEGYRDVDNVLPDARGRTNAGEDLYISSNFGKDPIFALQDHYGYPKLADYLNDTGSVDTISPKAYAAYGFGGAARHRSSPSAARPAPCRRPGPCPAGSTAACAAPPASTSRRTSASECGSRYFVERNKTYDTDKVPASLYSAQDDRYLVGDEPGHEGGDLWATDATLDVMEQRPDWSGIFVTLPGVDKAAHMWGGVNDPEAEGAGRRPDDAHGVRRRRPPTPRSAGSWTPSRRAATSTTPSSC